MVRNGFDNTFNPNTDGYNDKPMYALSHLATFKVKSENETKNPKEKMELLIELDKNGGIWPLKMFMCFSGQWLVMLDSDKHEIENFPGSLIKEPTAFISEDPSEVFNNILIFTVPGISLGVSEMHMFQVSGVSAVHLVEDLNLLSSGMTVHIDRNDTPFKSPELARNHKDKYTIDSTVDHKSFEGRQQYERDILVANHCFEDIERFVARLQFAAEAILELERNQHAHNHHGEGLLVLRSRPPLEKDFQDIIAKHKLALNYIAKLQHTFNNAIEPIHNVLTSLITVVNICQDVYVGEMIPENVVNPLLRRETVNFLMGCLNEQEMEFWNSLGQYWVVPKDHFKNHKGSYHPIFYDDWSPDWNVDEPVDYLPTEVVKDLAFPNSQQSWLTRLETRNARIGQAIFSWACRNGKELEVTKGEYLEIVDDSRSWWKARNCMGQIGYVPHTILIPRNFEPPFSFYPKDTDSLGSHVFETDASKIVETGHLAETARIMSRSYSMPAVPIPPPMPQSDESQKNTLRNALDQSSLPGNPVVAIRPRNTSETPTEALNEELRYNLKQREQRKGLEILITPQIYITQYSSQQEVEEWLRGKGFSDVIVQKLKTLNGGELFALSPHVIEGYFGQKESRRLISQIILQKNISEYKSVRLTELSTKLARMRQMIEKEDSNSSH